ncbi:MAG: heavy metal transporter [Bacteroidetes bacterium]|nr:heavy metal transporter [Bacteroidota bacterium]
MSTQQSSTKQTVVQIGGMACSGCSNAVQKALENQEGVTSATVGLEKETASITYHPETVSTDDFKQAIEEAGYEFKGVK